MSTKEQAKEWRLKHPDYAKNWRNNHLESRRKQEKIWSKTWKNKNPEKVILSGKKYYKKNQEKIKTYSKTYRLEHLEKNKYYNITRRGKKRAEWLMRAYSMSVEDYYNLFMQQNGRCAICGKEASINTKCLRVDHDHITGEIRGLLCHTCNGGIGLLKDSPILVQSALDYLLKKQS